MYHKSMFFPFLQWKTQIYSRYLLYDHIKAEKIHKNGIIVHALRWLNYRILYDFLSIWKYGVLLRIEENRKNLGLYYIVNAKWNQAIEMVQILHKRHMIRFHYEHIPFKYSLLMESRLKMVSIFNDTRLFGWLEGITYPCGLRRLSH